MALSQSDIVNRAVQLIGGFNNNGPVSGTPPTFDNTPIGIAAGVVYNSVVQTVGRQFGWDFSRNIVSLTLSGNAAPFPFALEYLYPTNGIQIRQVLPPSLTDPNNPPPVNWTVGNNTVASIPTKVIWTDQAGALGMMSNQPPEALWDGLFTEAVVRLLASELAMAVPARPDTSRDLLSTAETFEKLGEKVDS